MSPAVFAPEGFGTYGLQFEPVNRSIMEYQALSQQEAREQYLKKIGKQTTNHSCYFPMKMKNTP